MSWKFTLSLLAICTLFSWQLSAQACGESFYDTGGSDGEYSNSESSEWTICPDNVGDLVTLNFTLVDVEGCCDVLSIYNGTGIATPLSIDLEAPESFTSSAADGCLTVTWSSDSSVTYDGWEATVSCAPPPPCPNPVSLNIVTATPNGATANWNQVGNVSAWDIEVVTTGSTPTGIPTAADINSTTYTWEGGDNGTTYDLYVRGHCDEEGMFSDWVGPVTFTTIPGCGSRFFDLGGSNAPYNNNENETWTFCPDNPGDVVTINFTTVVVENCCDNLAIYNGTGTGTPLEPDLEAPGVITSTAADGCLTVTWSSDGSVTRRGWAADIICAPAPACPTPSDLLVTNITGEGADFSWIENGMATAWDLEIVLRGTAPSGTPTIYGVTTNPYTWTGGESGTEYDVYIRAQCGQEEETSYWTARTRFFTNPNCGDSFFDSNGPNGNYFNNELSTWTFCPDTPGEIVVLDFTFVGVESCCDVLSIFNGSTFDEPLNEDLEAPETFISTATDGCITVTWDSDGSVRRPGWEADIICTPCPPTLSAQVSTENIAAFNADIIINSISESSYLVEYGELGFVQGEEGTIITSASTTINLTALDENTSYEYYLTTICPDGAEGNLLGPYSFTTLYADDIGISALLSPDDSCGLGIGENMTISITNYGANPQTLFPINFSVNGVLAGVSQPQDGFYTGIISRDSTEIFEFDTNYDFEDAGAYTIQVWTEMGSDSNTANDTLTIVLNNYAPPIYEDFETGVLNDIFSINPVDNFIAAPNAHGNATSVLTANLFTSSDEFILDFPVLSIIETDTLFFDYRYVDWASGSPTTLGANHHLMVMASLDCGETYEIVYDLAGNQHTPTADLTTLAVPLQNYTDEKIKLRIYGTYGGNGDYWLDVDNVNIPRCDGLGASADVTHVSEVGASDGSITALPASGIEPFSYTWNTGDTTAVISNLAPGDYTVSITDRLGCSGELTVTVDIATSLSELPTVISTLQLAPNPTASSSVITTNFVETVDARIDIINVLGQRVWESSVFENVTQLQENVDMAAMPSGIYFVRVHAQGQSASMKLIKK